MEANFETRSYLIIIDYPSQSISLALLRKSSWCGMADPSEMLQDIDRDVNLRIKENKKLRAFRYHFGQAKEKLSSQPVITSVYMPKFELLV